MDNDKYQTDIFLEEFLTQQIQNMLSNASKNNLSLQKLIKFIAS